MSIYSFNKPQDHEQQQVKTEQVHSSKVGEQEKASTEKMAEQEGKKEAKEKVVVIDGPLSEVYTKALNIALANESVMVVAASSNKPTTATNKAALTEKILTNDEEDDAEYLYVLDSKSNDSQALEAFNNLAAVNKSGKYKKIHVAVENASTLSKKMSLVLEGAMSLGANILTSNSDLVGKVANTIKK